MSSGTTAAASEASTAAAKHGHRVAKTMPGLPSGAAQKQFSSAVCTFKNANHADIEVSETGVLFIFHFFFLAFFVTIPRKKSTLY